MHFNYIWKVAVLRDKRKAPTGIEKRRRDKNPPRKALRVANFFLSLPHRGPPSPNDIFYGNLIIDWIVKEIFYCSYSLFFRLQKQNLSRKTKATFNSYSRKSMEMKLALWCNISIPSYLDSFAVFYCFAFFSRRIYYVNYTSMIDFQFVVDAKNSD